MIHCRSLQSIGIGKGLASCFLHPVGVRRSLYSVGGNLARRLSTSTPPPPPQDDHVQPGGFKSSFSISRPIENLILRSRLTRDVDMARFLGKSAGIAIYTLAGVTALGTLGVDTKPIIAGIGVTGFTLGFALKEIATNFLSGVLLVFNKPFQKGQHLKVLGAAAGQNLEGEVESIDARYVLLRTKDRGLVMVPSVVVYTSPLLVSKTEKKV
ncbi:hypothetical protein PSACC_03441 [Paramicrosporidium saccamoebae]|uniref:Uncharacterized protein n=1 Tax=Paramicrosporidium saccamoebae TaxID=1246581 RepID=A0A2H9TFY2_9FUNG|nr:hypothetical protein PSACC_03441 [Paramicrosporidium saccamoebae]